MITGSQKVYKCVLSEPRKDYRLIQVPVLGSFISLSITPPAHTITFHSQNRLVLIFEYQEAVKKHEKTCCNQPLASPISRKEQYKLC